MLLFLFTCTLSRVLCNTNYSNEESEILVLNNKTFDSAIADNEYILINFYASWCKYSQKLIPHYIETGKKVSKLKLPVKLAQIEATEEDELRVKYNVLGFPSLILFRRGVPINHDDYAGDIVKWLQSQVRPATKELFSFEEALNLIDTENVTVIGFYDNLLSFDAKKFVKIAESFDEPSFAITSNEEVMKRYNVTSGTIMLLKKFINESVVFVDDLTLTNMRNFVERGIAPLIQELDYTNVNKIFKNVILNHLLVFVSKKSNDLETLLNLAKPVAEEFKDKIGFVIINIDEENHKEVLPYFDLKLSEIPAIGLISNGETNRRYKMNDTITTNNIRKFLQDFESEKLNQIFFANKQQEVGVDEIQ